MRKEVYHFVSRPAVRFENLFHVNTSVFLETCSKSSPETMLTFRAHTYQFMKVTIKGYYGLHHDFNSSYVKSMCE